MEQHPAAQDAFGSPIPHGHKSIATVPLSVVVGQQAHHHRPQALAGVGKNGVLNSPHHHSSYVEMYDPDFHHVISVAPEKILHTPHPSLGVSRLVLCRNFVAGSPVSSCTKGDTCKFVHADILGAKKHPIHVNYAWRSWDLVTYPRLPAGETLVVFAPNERPPADDVPSEQVLITRGSLMRKEHTGPLSHCAHYYFNRMCNRGERCNFIHAVIVDPNATDLQRAPAPTTIAPLVRGPPCKKSIVASPPGGGVMTAAPQQLHSPLAVNGYPGSQPQQHLAAVSGGYSVLPNGILASQPNSTLQPIPSPSNSGAPYLAPQSYIPPQQQQQSLQQVASASSPGSSGTYLVLNSNQIVATGPQSFTPPPPGAQVYFVQQQQPPSQLQQQQTTPSVPPAMFTPVGGWQQQPLVAAPLQPHHVQSAPSMTSLFSSQVSSTPLPVPMQQQANNGTTSPGRSIGGMSQINNPMEWSMIGGLYNTGSMSASMSLSNSHSGATVVLQKMMNNNE